METVRNRNTRFEDLECWQNAKDMTVHIYRLISEDRLKKDKELREALTKKTVYMMSHIALGYDGGVQAYTESAKHLERARECLAVLRTYFVIIRELGYLTEGDFLEFEDKSIQIAVLIDAQIKTALQKSKTGRKVRKEIGSS